MKILISRTVGVEPGQRAGIAVPILGIKERAAHQDFSIRLNDHGGDSLAIIAVHGHFGGRAAEGWVRRTVAVEPHDESVQAVVTFPVVSRCQDFAVRLKCDRRNAAVQRRSENEVRVPRPARQQPDELPMQGRLVDGVARDQDSAVRLNEDCVKARGQIVRIDNERGVQRAVGQEPRQPALFDSIHLSESAANHDLSIGLQSQPGRRAIPPPNVAAQSDAEAGVRFTIRKQTNYPTARDKHLAVRLQRERADERQPMDGTSIES